MNQPVRTTLIYSLLTSFAIYPALVWGLTPILGWPLAARLTLWLAILGYALLLARWSNTKIFSILFPLGLLLWLALWPHAYQEFYLLFCGVFIWIRSGICFTQHPLRALLAEATTIIGGVAVIGFWLPSGIWEWGLGIWLFGLIQCLYFYIVPLNVKESKAFVGIDPFEKARQEAEKVLGRQWEH